MNHNSYRSLKLLVGEELFSIISKLDQARELLCTLPSDLAKGKNINSKIKDAKVDIFEAMILIEKIIEYIKEIEKEYDHKMH